VREQKEGHMTILIAEDNEDEQLIAKRALRSAGVSIPIRFVNDGIELMDYLYQRGRFSDSQQHPKPHLIFLDLNMPLMDGHEALSLIKEDAHLRQIPIIVLSTSANEGDIERCYQSCVNAYLVKPASFDQLTQTFQAFSQFWLGCARYPELG
jgi:CheY-like chemotaxis protein